MNMIAININIATREKGELVECCSTALAEDLCTIVCRNLHISPIATTLFSLRLPDSNIYLPPNSRVDKYSNLILRIRFRVPNLTRLKNLDVQAHNYYFHQVKNDVLENRIPEIVYAKHRDELLGLGITDMYRLMVEEKKNREEVEKDYRKYIPREVIKRHKIFTKKPIHTTLAQFAKSGYADAGFIKEQYLKKLNTMAPNYLSEEYEVVYVSNAVEHPGVLHVMPFHKDEPGLRMHNKTKKEWEYLCTIDELCFMSSGQDKNIEISRINGRPVYLKFSDQQRMLSFISVCDGYYRLMVKWTFNLCKVVTSPALQMLHDMKCHGPVGGEFSYHKLEDKRANKPGCFILRQCEKYFDTFYIDVCSKASPKPETYKIEKRGNTYTLHQNELSDYPSWAELISKHRLPDGNIYLQECLPPSEYDKSQVLLCEDVGRGVGGKIGQDTLEDMLANIKGPRCIHTKDILVFKRPWCYVDSGDGKVYAKEFCDIPLCDRLKRTFLTIEREYGHYISLSEDTSSLSFGLKLWDPDSVMYAYGKVTLSVLAIPGNKEDVKRWGMGVEIIISAAGTGMNIGTEKIVLTPHPILLNSTTYRYFKLDWTEDAIILSLPKENNKVVFAGSITKKQPLYQKNKLAFYSIHGSNILWKFPEIEVCEIHTTTDTEFSMKSLFAKKSYKGELEIYVRSYHSVQIELLSTPISYTFRILIKIGNKDGKTLLILEDYNKETIVLGSSNILNSLDYWKWNEFFLSIDYDTLNLYWMGDSGLVNMLSSTYDFFRNINWYAIGSDKTVSHWTLNCIPSSIPVAEPPNCGAFQIEYFGDQWVSSQGYPCLPWVDTQNIPNSVKNGKDYGSLAALSNYCREYLEGIKGPACMAMTPSGYEGSLCRVRGCSTVACAISGTGVDYVGDLNVTRKSRTCIPWEIVDANEQTKFSPNAFDFDENISKARNHCRNPTLNIGGSWCYTEDVKLPIDLCGVSDCNDDKHSALVFVSPADEKNMFLIYPEWKLTALNISLKVWDTEKQEGLTIKIYPRSREEYLSFTITKDGQKIILSHVDRYNYKSYLRQEITPELIPIGKWGKYWFRFARGSILFGYKDVKKEAFKWVDKKGKHTFEPLYVTFLPVEHHPIGIIFPNKECLIEKTTSNKIFRFMSLGVWETKTKAVLTLHLRGDGKANILLSILPNTDDYYSLSFDYKDNKITLEENTKSGTNSLVSANVGSRLFTGSTWTKFKIEFTENTFKVSRNGKSVLSHKSGKLLVLYWYTLIVERGWVMWAANCYPLDPGVDPIDGGWSMWSKWDCDAKCDGGKGIRFRVCDSPRPNINGKSCIGPIAEIGSCNEYECGDLPPFAVQNIKLAMKTYYSSLVAKEGERVSFNHSMRMALSLHKDSPKTKVFWTFNGRILKLIKNSKDWKDLKKRGLHIGKVKTADTGIYALIVRRHHNRKLFVSIETLAVRSKRYDIVELIDTEKIIPCKALPLGLAYEELTQKWFLNDRLYKNHGVTLLPLTDKLFVKLNKSHRLWKCQVSTDFGFNWTTNIVSVNIKDVGIIAMLMEDEMVGPFFNLFGSDDNVLIFVIFASILFVIVTCIGMYKCLKFDLTNIPLEKRIEKNLDKEPKNNKKHPKTDAPKMKDQKIDNQKKDKLEGKKGSPANKK